VARSQSSAALKYIGAAGAAIAGGIAIGYLFGGVRPPHPPVQTEQPPVSATLTPTPSVSPSTIHPLTTNGNYTAPGAPRIDIQEESQPILRRVTPPSAPPPDSEATQEAAPTPPAPPADQTQSTDTTTPPAETGSATTTTPAPETSPANTGGSTASSPTPPPAPADPDFEHVNSGGTPPSAADPEAGQQGSAPGESNSGSSGKVQFRVQTGAYTDESDARSIADQLRGQGYATSTRSERQGDHLVYKVQVGAYRSKNGANKAADDLQKKGYSAYVSPIGP
jgi:cell division protein FtsN